MRKLLIIVFAVFSILVLSCHCSKPTDGNDSGKTDVGTDKNEILEKVKATKIMNSYDDAACWVYSIDKGKNSPNSSISRFVDRSVKTEGRGSFRLNYSFDGTTTDDRPEYVSVQQSWGDFRPDLSFEPLGISLWVKGSNSSDETLRLVLIQDETFATVPSQRNMFAYEDGEILKGGEWAQWVIPYSAFTQFNGKAGAKLDLSRFIGYRLDIINTSGEKYSGQVNIDKLEQLTTYAPEYKPARFTSLFIQLNKVYENENWESDFTQCKEVGIDTWIIQYSVGYGNENGVSWYKNSNAPWIKSRYDIIDKMVAAAEKTGFKLIFGLYGGDYDGSHALQSTYDPLIERNKLVIDEIYNAFGNSPSFAGWYITEEFHDGTYPSGWLTEPSRSLLANYLQTVAAYCKSKPQKYPVQIAPALWRGRPADMSGEFFREIFKKTPDVDFLYLQDCAGRCNTDEDVDLPNYYAEIKKACDETGVEFGVDIESFLSCWCPDEPYRAKSWNELKQQLQIAGLYTKHITNFSWATFKPGLNSFEGYKNYLNEGK